MSIEAIRCVFDHAPGNYRGALFTIALAIADTVNKDHRFEFFGTRDWLADKARVSRSTVGAAFETLESDGWIVRVRDTQQGRHADGQAVRYRWVAFLGDDRTSATRVTGDRLPVTGHRSPPSYSSTQTEPNNPYVGRVVTSKKPFHPDHALDAKFDRFWTFYPRKINRLLARQAWEEALVDESAEAIQDGVERFAADPNLPGPAEVRFVPHPTTWLHGGRWGDGPLAPRPGAGGRGDDGAIIARLEERRRRREAQGQ